MRQQAEVRGQTTEVKGEKKEKFASVLHLLDSDYWLLRYYSASFATCSVKELRSVVDLYEHNAG